MSEMSKQQQLLKHELSITQILRVYGKQFRQIKRQYSDEINGRGAVGVIMSYFGWNGIHNSDTPNSLQMTLQKLKDAGIRSGTIIKAK
jgi:hypothetical protein